MTLPNCKCGDAPESVKCYKLHEVRCLNCGIFIYAHTQEQAETIWTDAQEAAELREKIKRMERTRTPFDPGHEVVGEV